MPGYFDRWEINRSLMFYKGDFLFLKNILVALLIYERTQNAHKLFYKTW